MPKAAHPATCRRHYVREEALEKQFTELLGQLKFDDEVLEWVRDALHASHADERRESNQWREEQNRCLSEIERHQSADKSYMDEGVQLLELARNAQRLFARQEPREKRRLLNFVLSNCTWEDSEVVATFRQPFDMLAETATSAARHEAENTAKSAKTEIWLGDLDSNQG
jgi:site-specific DNA recombinase